MKIIHNDDKKFLETDFSNILNDSDTVNIITAFFSNSDILQQSILNNKSINLLVSLRPPTSYYALKELLPNSNVHIKFLGKNLHSKIYIFYKNNKANYAIIGSSNLTAGGLKTNIESNIIINEAKELAELDIFFNKIFKSSFNLEPSDLEKYKTHYDRFVKRKSEQDKENEYFLKKIKLTTRKKKQTVKLDNNAKAYYDFWKIVDDVKDIVKDISDKEYPMIPYYIAIDHFWHWIKIIWDKDRTPEMIQKNKNNEIRRLFKLYIEWDKTYNNKSFTNEMQIKSKTIFKKHLSLNHIDLLTIDESLEVYKNLHSTGMRIKRFNADEEFEKNGIQKIIKSLKYLLYSDDEIVYRISNLINKKSEYKLDSFGKSNIQEINGWVNPEQYPIRNDKADDAVKILGYKI